MIVEVEIDPETNEYILPLGEELCAEMGWVVGDTILWTDNKDGTWSIRKIKNANVTLSCGHTVAGFENSYDAIVKKYSDSGERCALSQRVCLACLNAYKLCGDLLANEDAAYYWLNND